MKKIFLFLAGMMVIMTIPGCKKLVDQVFPGVDIQLADIDLTIPPIPVVSDNEFSLGSFTVQFNLDSAVRANTGGVFGIGVVSSVKVTQISMSLSNADPDNNLANFSSARVTLSSNSNSTPTDLININFPDSTASSLTVTPTNSPELIGYLSGTQLTYNFYGKARRTTNKSLNMALSVTLRVK